MKIDALHPGTFEWFEEMSKKMSVRGGKIPAGVFYWVPDIYRVIYSPPATIIIWADKTKTVVKCSDGDEYSRTTGLALCILKKVYGPKRYREILKKHLTE